MTRLPLGIAVRWRLVLALAGWSLVALACWQPRVALGLAVLACHLIRRGARADREAAARKMRGRGSEPETVDAARRIR